MNVLWVYPIVLLAACITSTCYFAVKFGVYSHRVVAAIIMTLAFITIWANG